MLQKFKATAGLLFLFLISCFSLSVSQTNLVRRGSGLLTVGQSRLADGIHQASNSFIDDCSM